jgi:hypothetical protein
MKAANAARAERSRGASPRGVFGCPNRSFCANICELCGYGTRDMSGSPKGKLKASRLIRLTLTRDLLRRALLRVRPDCSKVSVPASVSASPKSYRNASRSMPKGGCGGGTARDRPFAKRRHQTGPLSLDASISDLRADGFERLSRVDSSGAPHRGGNCPNRQALSPGQADS